MNTPAPVPPSSPRFAVIAPDVVLGQNVVLNEFINLYGCTIGDGSMVGTFVEIQKDVAVGKACRIQSHSFLCSGVTLQDRVFVGHGVIFINDQHPSVAAALAGTWPRRGIIVEEDASIGSGALILGGVRIGHGALVGAGAVVTHDVAPGSTVIGIPAREHPRSDITSLPRQEV